jgi:hypothetical protein
MAVLAANLATLRREIDSRFPKRDKESDGWIGDSRHQARKSDHNPDARGVVNAIDVDKDGIDTKLLIRCAINHPTCEYVIHERTIWSRSRGFKPRRYTGQNPHTKHVHISGRHEREFQDSKAPWGVATGPIVPETSRRETPGRTRPGSRTLQLTEPRMKGEDVAFIQRFIGKNQCGPADGFFGPKTEAGVRFYQKLRGLPVNGVCDKTVFRNMGV